MKLIYSLIILLCITLTLPLRILAAPTTTLRLTSTNTSYAPQAQFATDILINTGSNSIVSSDLVLSFNPVHLEATDVQVGSFLPGANVIQKKMDNTNGTITLSLFTHKENARQGNGILAKIYWRAKSTGQSTLTFDSKKTLVYGLEEGNVLQSTSPLTLTVSTSGSSGTIFTPISPSPTKTNTFFATEDTDHTEFAPSSSEQPVSQNTGETNNPGNVLPSSAFVDESIVSRMVSTFTDIFTPDGESRDADPKQAPVFTKKGKSSPFQPIFLVWIVGGTLLVGGGIFIYIKKFRNKPSSTTPIPETSASSLKSEN